MWIVPAPMCAMRYINDPRYMVNDKAPARGRTRAANIRFAPPPDNFTPNVISDYRTQPLTALRNVTAGEEFYIDYSSRYIMRPSEN